MIKGINHQIIEVTDTNNIYYERAWLVVRPEYSRVQKCILEREARKLIKNMKTPSSMKPKRAWSFWLLRLGASAIMGAGCVLLFQAVIF